MHTIKQVIYHSIHDFLHAYKNEDKAVLAERFGIVGDFLAEIYEMLDFVADKSTLHICALEDVNRQISGQDYLDVFDYNEDSDDNPADDCTDYGVECALFMNNEHIGYIVGDYHPKDAYPQFEFKYFSV